MYMYSIFVYICIDTYICIYSSIYSIYGVFVYIHIYINIIYFLMDLLKGIVLHLVFSKLHPPLISAVELTPGEQVKTMVFISKRFFSPYLIALNM